MDERKGRQYLESLDFHPTDSLLIGQQEYPPDSTLRVESVNGMKEGPATLVSKRGTILARLQYCNNKLHGLCIFYNEAGEKEEEIVYKNDIPNGWFCSYENRKPIWMGINLNGVQISQLFPSFNNSSLFEEIQSGKRISICQFNTKRNRNGICYFYQNDSLISASLFDDGIEKYQVYAFENKTMTEFNAFGSIVYKGEFSGNEYVGFIQNGKGIKCLYHGTTLYELQFIRKGKIIKRLLFDTVMKEYDERDVVIYEGEYEGNVENGFVWNGWGICYTSPTSFFYGIFNRNELEVKKGESRGNQIVEFDDQERVVYYGEYQIQDGRVYPYGKGCRCTFNHAGMTVSDCENGKTIQTKYTIDGELVSLYNDNGCCIYQGMFRGNFLSGIIREGEGDESDNDICIYKGNWNNDQKDGFGRYFHEGELRYRGMWKNNKPNGHGEFFNENGDMQYEGEWEDGHLFIGEGKYVRYEDGAIFSWFSDAKQRYRGDMQNGLPEGHGVFYDANGKALYEGEWTQGWFAIQKGLSFHYEDEKIYGMYNETQKRYDGEMKQGAPHGRGTYFSRDGEVLYEGEWEEGWFQVDAYAWFYYDEEVIKVFDADTNLVYEGGWDNHCPNGYGRTVNEQGETVYEGEWTDGVLVLDQDAMVEIVLEEGKVFLQQQNTVLGFIHRMTKTPWKEEMSVLTITESTQWDLIECIISELSIGEGCCNDLKGELMICNYPHLQCIIVEENALNGVQSFVLSQNPHLKYFEVQGRELDLCDSLMSVTDVVFSGIGLH